MIIYLQAERQNGRVENKPPKKHCCNSAFSVLFLPRIIPVYTIFHCIPNRQEVYHMEEWLKNKPPHPKSGVHENYIEKILFAKNFYKIKSLQ